MPSVQKLLVSVVLFVLYCQSIEAKPQAVNPCIALRLPLCKVNQNFAKQHGIEAAPQAEKQPQRRVIPTSRPAAVAPPSRIRDFSPESTQTREGDTLIVTPFRTVSQPETVKDSGGSLRSTLIDRLRSRKPASTSTSNSNRRNPNSNRNPTTTSATSETSETSGNQNRFSNNASCKGLRFCVLSKDVSSGGNSRRPAVVRPKRPDLSEDDLVKAFFASPLSSGNLINLVLQGDIEEANAHIERGGDVNVADQHGNSVLHIAAQNGRDGVIKSLILNGADVNQGNNHKNVPLHLAAQNGFHKVAEVLLLAKKIDVDAKDLHFNTALHLAAQNGQLEVARMLLEAGAKHSEGNAHKHTPLHLSAQNKFLELTKLLVQAGADMDYQDLIGNTPLHTAYHNSQTQIAQYLISAGANETIRNKSGLTPFQLAGKK